MNTDIARPAILYTVTDETIADLGRQCAGLTIRGMDDVDGYRAVHKARQACVKARGDIERTRKALKAESLEFGRRVDAEAKRLEGAVETIELRLVNEMQAIDDARERIKREAEDQRFAVREEAWRSADGPLTSREALLGLSDEQFRATIERLKNAQVEKRQAEERAAAERKERARLAAEAEERNRLESLRLAEERKRLDAEKAALKAEQDRLNELERRRVEVARLEAQKKAAVEAALREEADRVERERAAAKRAEELRPAKEKLFAFADAILSTDKPHIDASTDAKLFTILTSATASIRRLAEELS